MDLLYWMLAREGKDPSDPHAVLMAEEAITDAQIWIWRQYDWWWARKTATFDTVPTSHVSKQSPVGTSLFVSNTNDFAAGDVVTIGLGTDKEEIGTVDSITLNSALVLKANLVNQHEVADAAAVVKLANFTRTATHTRVDSASSAQTLNVAETTGFSVGDLIEIGTNSSTPEINKIETITAGASFGVYGTLINDPGADVRVTKVEALRRSYALRSVNGGAMRDLGRLISIRVDDDGILTPVHRSEWERGHEDDLSGRLSAGDRYIIEGDPPTLEFERQPSANQTIYVDYSQLPPRYRGTGNIVVPAPFQDLLKHVALWYFREDDENKNALEDDPKVMRWLDQMKGWRVGETAHGVMRKPSQAAVLAGIFPVEPEDFLDVDGIPIN